MSSATTTAETRGRVRVEVGEKRVRGFLGGVPVADTSRPILVWEGPRYPTYYFPAEDVRTDLLSEDGGVAHSPSRGEGRTFTLKVGEREAAGAALRYDESPIEALRNAVRFDWGALDAWFEEDEQVFTHARDPYTRIDILSSSRHVRVELHGTTIAESTSPRLLFETGLPVRYYLPKTHARMELLLPTDTVSHCPYKGQAEWWSARAGDQIHTDVAWSYRAPFAESQKIAGLIAFYNHMVDLYVDGVLDPLSSSSAD
jgi:uncharacterized protein (DUF427 family)